MILKTLALCGLVSFPLLASEVVYTNQSFFTAAVNSLRNRSVLTEDFSSTTLIPGLAVVSQGGGVFGLPVGPGYGHVDVAHRAWLDCVGKDCPGSFGLGAEPYTSTMISFKQPLFGFAGLWKIDEGDGISLFPDNAGEADILFSTDPTATIFPVPSTAYPQGFVGFTTDRPFRSVFITSFSEPGSGVSTSFELRKLELVTTPEPSPSNLLALAGLIGGLLTAATASRHRRLGGSTDTNC